MDPALSSALATIAAAVAATAAVFVARDALRASHAGLFAQLLHEYGSSQMGDDLGKLHAFYDADPSTVAARYRAGIMATPRSPDFEQVSAARRRVSQYFKSVVRLCDAHLVDSGLIVKIYGARIAETCRNVLAPIDEEHSIYATGESDDSRFAEFYKIWFDKATQATIRKRP